MWGEASDQFQLLFAPFDPLGQEGVAAICPHTKGLHLKEVILNYSVNVKAA